MEVQTLIVAALNEAAKQATIMHAPGHVIAAAGKQGADIVVMTSTGRLYLLTLQSAYVAPITADVQQEATSDG